MTQGETRWIRSNWWGFLHHCTWTKHTTSKLLCHDNTWYHNYEALPLLAGLILLSNDTILTWYDNMVHNISTWHIWVKSERRAKGSMQVKGSGQVYSWSSQEWIWSRSGAVSLWIHWYQCSIPVLSKIWPGGISWQVCGGTLGQDGLLEWCCIFYSQGTHGQSRILYPSLWCHFSQEVRRHWHSSCIQPDNKVYRGWWTLCFSKPQCLDTLLDTMASPLGILDKGKALPDNPTPIFYHCSVEGQMLCFLKLVFWSMALESWVMSQRAPDWVGAWVTLEYQSRIEASSLYREDRRKIMG